MSVKKLGIVVIVATVTVVIVLLSVWGFAIDETSKFKNNLDELMLVKNCVPALLDDAPVPDIPIMNDTHKFDLRTCQWDSLK